MHEWFKPTCSNVLLIQLSKVSDVDERIDFLDENFRQLYSDMRTEFINSNHITRTEVLDTVTDIPSKYKEEYKQYLRANESRLEKAESVGEILRVLRAELHFTDCALIEHLINKLGTEDLKSKVVLYKRALRGFLRGTTVEHIIQSDQWPGVKKSNLPEGFMEIKAEINHDPSQYNLEKLDRLRRRICSQLRLAEVITFLKGAADFRSFLVSWMFPAMFYQTITDEINHLDILFVLREQILLFVVGDKYFCPQDEKCGSVVSFW